jgi:hypothetical protein
MHIGIGTVLLVAIMLGLYFWRQERKRLADIRRGLHILYPRATAAEIRKYVKDVYG